MAASGVCVGVCVVMVGAQDPNTTSVVSVMHAHKGATAHLLTTTLACSSIPLRYRPPTHPHRPRAHLP